MLKHLKSLFRSKEKFYKLFKPPSYEDVLNEIIVLFARPQVWIKYTDGVTGYTVEGLTPTNALNILQKEYPNVLESDVRRAFIDLTRRQIIYVAYNRMRDLEPVYRPLRYMD